MGQFFFSPTPLTIAAGDTVRWTNPDAIPHTSTGPGWDTGVLLTGDANSHTFTTAGTFDYLCTIHPTQMQARIVVTG